MTAARQVSLHSLEKAVSRVLDHLTGELGPLVRLPHDAYWAIPPQERFDMTAVPAPTVGQVTEELEHLDQVLADPDLPPGIALVWLGRLLECLGTGLLADDAGRPGTVR